MNRRLYRSRTDSMIGGVAAGLAGYLNSDPALVRIVWAILVVVTGGAAFVVYIIAWVVVPEEPIGPADPVAAAAEPTTDPVTGEVVAPAVVPATVAASTPSVTGGQAGVVVGIGLVVIGLWFLLREYLPEIDWSLIWPLVLVGIGVLILVTSMRRRDR
jgi:phage shock protein PspC (stress-responsive transcriptional regulator)